MCKRSRVYRRNNTTKSFQHKGAFKIQQNSNGRRPNKQWWDFRNCSFSFLFSFYDITKMLSQQESIKQKCLSTFLFFLLSLFSFFLFSLTLSRWTEACNKVHSQIQLLMKQNLFRVLSFIFFNTYNFPICRSYRRKTV